MTDPFDTPASPSGLDLKTINGSLLLITVHEVVPHVPTVHSKPGERSPAVRCDVAVLDGAEAGKEYVDTLIFPKVLQGQLGPRAGKKPVLARLGQGTAKPGQSPPWQLSTEVTDNDRKLGVAYLQNGFATAASTGGGSPGEPPF